MVRTSSSSTRKLIGAGAVAALLFAPAGLRAQQLAANADITSDRQAYITSQCGPIERADLECVARSSIAFTRAQTALSKQKIDEANQRLTESARLQQCIAFLGQKRDAGVVFDRKITRENVCSYATELGMPNGPG